MGHDGDWPGRNKTIPVGERVILGDLKMAVGWSLADYDAARRLVANRIIRLDGAR